MQKIRIKNFFIGEGEPLCFICGPCIIESEEHCLQAAQHLKSLFAQQPAHFIFKSSYDKANRSSLHSFRGPGLDEGLRILQKVQKECDLPVLTDVHSPAEAKAAGQVCDFIQIPAFLCRQTDLIVAAAQTPAAVNVKKGQFLSPWEMKNVVEKMVHYGKRQILLTDRGFSFGYNNLVSDFRAIPIMQSLGFPVCFDATHSVQLPGGMGTHSGGTRQFIPTLAKAAVAAGANCIFIEAHPHPFQAKSDSATVMDFQDIPALIATLCRLHQALHGQQALEPQQCP